MCREEKSAPQADGEPAWLAGWSVCILGRSGKATSPVHVQHTQKGCREPRCAPRVPSLAELAPVPSRLPSPSPPIYLFI